MSSLNQKYNNWQNGNNHSLPNPTNTNFNYNQSNNINPTSPGINGYVPIKTIEYNQYRGMNGNIVKRVNLFNTYV